MPAISNAQLEMLMLKKVIEARDPELLLSVHKDLIATSDLSKIFNLVNVLYMENLAMPSFDLVKAELENRVINSDKRNFYKDLVEDIKTKDATGITTEDLLGKLKEQHQFRIILSGAGSLIDAVEKRDAGAAVGVMKSMQDGMFLEGVGQSLDEGDMCRLAGKLEKHSFRKVGIKELDALGILPDSSLNLVCAPSKAGKSVMALQFLIYGHDNYEGSSDYISYELGYREVVSRLLSFRSEVNIGLITSDMLTPEQRLALREAEVQHLCDYNNNMKDFIQETRGEPNETWWKLFWDHFQPRNNRFYIPPIPPKDWNELFLYMQMMVERRNVKTFCIDYINLVPMAREDKVGWESILIRSRQLKSFARNNQCRIITPVQLDDRDPGLKIRFSSGILCDCDVAIGMKQDDEDKELNASTIHFMAMRNYTSTPGKNMLQPVKLLRRFDVCKFESLGW